jgi:hypothetical protein
MAWLLPWPFVWYSRMIGEIVTVSIHQPLLRLFLEPKMDCVDVYFST